MDEKTAELLKKYVRVRLDVKLRSDITPPRVPKWQHNNAGFDHVKPYIDIKEGDKLAFKVLEIENTGEIPKRFAIKVYPYWKHGNKKIIFNFSLKLMENVWELVVEEYKPKTPLPEVNVTISEDED